MEVRGVELELAAAVAHPGLPLQPDPGAISSFLRSDLGRPPSRRHT